MNKCNIFATVIILTVLMMTMPSTGNAATLSQAEKLVQKAESAATILKWEISLEHRKVKYSDPVTLPNMNLYNDTKRARQLAYDAIKSLPLKRKRS